MTPPQGTEKGSVLVETAISILFLLALVWGLLSIGRCLMQLVWLDNATFSAAYAGSEVESTGSTARLVQKVSDTLSLLYHEHNDRWRYIGGKAPLQIVNPQQAVAINQIVVPGPDSTKTEDDDHLVEVELKKYNADSNAGAKLTILGQMLDVAVGSKFIISSTAPRPPDLATLDAFNQGTVGYDCCGNCCGATYGDSCRTPCPTSFECFNCVPIPNSTKYTCTSVCD